jgi:lipopolysaccharide transport system ATP-binding protein
VSDRLVEVEELGKLYHLYSRPQDRLKELVIGRRYSRDFWALRDVSFTLPRGQRLGIIGRNGSGKSTLLQMLAGTLAPSEGRLEIAGRVGALLELGSGFNPDYTGRENIYLNASILGLTPAETAERFDEIVAFADIGDFLDQPVKTYSSGMFVRLAFAVTTSVSADLLLIDEALAVGDVFFTQKCFRHLEDLIARQVSTILVTHDTTAVNQFCDRVIVLDQGRVEFDGDSVGAIRTYFALQRSVGRPIQRQADTPARLDAPTTPGAWPDPSELLSLEGASVQTTGAARCTAVALCRADGEGADTFEMGDDAIFFYEFTVDTAIDTPIGGISLVNERNLIVHGRNSLQLGVPAVAHAPRGSRLRFRQRMRLDLAPGRYTFVIGLASIAHDDYTHADRMSHGALHARTTRECSVTNVSAFTVSARRHGVALPFHGLCGIDGDCALDLVTEPAGASV